MWSRRAISHREILSQMYLVTAASIGIGIVFIGMEIAAKKHEEARIDKELLMSERNQFKDSTKL